MAQYLLPGAILSANHRPVLGPEGRDTFRICTAVSVVSATVSAQRESGGCGRDGHQGQ